MIIKYIILIHIATMFERMAYTAVYRLAHLLESLVNQMLPLGLLCATCWAGVAGCRYLKYLCQSAIAQFMTRGVAYFVGHIKFLS